MNTITQLRVAVMSRQDEEFSELQSQVDSFCADIRVKPAVIRYTSDEPFRMESENEGFHYDLAVVALPGAEGMEAVLGIRERFPRMLVIWITDDKYFAGMAMRCHIHDFLLRPVSTRRLEEALSSAIQTLRQRRTMQAAQEPTRFFRRNA